MLPAASWHSRFSLRGLRLVAARRTAAACNPGPHACQLTDHRVRAAVSINLLVSKKTKVDAR